MEKIRLSSSALFRGFSLIEEDAFEKEIVTEIRSFEKGELIARQGDSVDALYLLVSGKVRTEMITKEGNLLEIEMIEAVNPLALAFIFADKNKFPVDVLAIKQCCVWLVSKTIWFEELMKNKVLLDNFLKMNANITVFLSNKLRMASIKSLKAKVAIYLLENTSLKNNVYSLKRSRTQLAIYFGVQRPSLVRTLKEMERKNAISLKGKDIEVIDRFLLEKMI